ncbi:DUF2442 domain-containing protein [Gaoshiqia sediminis]|uniref:DUF2442 domain-containing protein n=1 Tax=Gaoshiqia sediminis TaxID=2986998 RepID=A0AA41YBQ2_9BACT|nr:DUF2442 domain-containing protein [Gaoshiqia sediminis]MCW0484858.1 DUF2442 domain-containing protein [Gaoshiqia sediminis]
MKIVEEYREEYGNPIKIDSAKYEGNFAVRIRFTDGTEKLVDFKPFLSKARHPSIKKYREEALFRKYRIVDGNLNWNDYELFFPIWDLYTGRIGA